MQQRTREICGCGREIPPLPPGKSVHPSPKRPFIVTEMTAAGARAKLSAMKALTVAAAILLLVSAPTRLLAQDMAGVPDTSYQASSAAPASKASDVPMPDSD